MDLGSVFVLLLVLACPLMMVWMMRGHGGHHGRGSQAQHSAEPPHEEPHQHTLAELRRRRDALDNEIEQRERAAEPKMPADV